MLNQITPLWIADAYLEGLSLIAVLAFWSLSAWYIALGVTITYLISLAISKHFKVKNTERIQKLRQLLRVSDDVCYHTPSKETIALYKESYDRIHNLQGDLVTEIKGLSQKIKQGKEDGTL